MFKNEIAASLAAIKPLAASDARIIIAIAGPPAAGKSTFSIKLLEAIRTELEPETERIPMDGFHYDNRLLEARGHLSRKGAPFTFDGTGLVSLLSRIKAGEDHIAYPVFDRALDLSIAGAGLVQAHTKIILVEGNYLLLNEAPWSALEPLFDLTLIVTAEKSTLEQRLIQRWVEYDHTPEQARSRALSNDIPNAHYVTQNSRAADLSFIS